MINQLYAIHCCCYTGAIGLAAADAPRASLLGAKPLFLVRGLHVVIPVECDVLFSQGVTYGSIGDHAVTSWRRWMASLPR